MSLLTKPLIFVVISVLVVALVYSSISAFNVFAAPNEAPLNADCEQSPYGLSTTCCWTETDPDDPEEGIELNWCQTCSKNGCNEKFPAPLGPTRLPTGPAAPLRGGVLQQTTPPPTSPFAPLGGGGVLQQPTTTPAPPPPLFGRNIPQDGGFDVLQEPETPPVFGLAPEGPTLAGEGENIQPMNTTFPTPQPFPPPTPGFKAPPIAADISPDLAPEDDQDETDDEGNDNIPDTGIAEQPETQQPEEEPSNEGQETAGPLT